MRENREQKKGVSPVGFRPLLKWSVPSSHPCSYRSRRSRFMIFSWRVRCNFHREMRDNRKTIYGLFFLVRTLRAIRGSRNSKGVSAIDSNRETRESREQKKGVSRIFRTFIEGSCLA